MGSQAGIVERRTVRLQPGSLLLAMAVIAMGAAPLSAQTFSVLTDMTATNGSISYAGLVLSGNTLYGTTSEGGGQDSGSVFSIRTNGTGFSVLHGFVYGTDGGYPYGNLVVSGGTLYGATSSGSTNGAGTVFALNTNGTTFTVLHRFAANAPGGNTNADGVGPVGSLLLAGDMLYGTTTDGGPNAAGTVFALNTNGTGFTVLYSFAVPDVYSGANFGGASPLGGLALAGNTLYGTTSAGGGQGGGTVFALNTNGSGFAVLHEFSAADPYTGTSPDGASPQGGLALSGNVLYGTTSSGGSEGSGAVFAVNTDGTGFALLHTFTALDPDTLTNTDGAWPYGDLMLSGSTLYGTTSAGGTDGNGTEFALKITGTGFSVLHSFTAPDPFLGTNPDGATPYGGLVLSGNTLFGTTAAGGDQGVGTVIAVRTNGTGFAVLHDFGPDQLLAQPQGDLAMTDGSIFATSAGGGSEGSGTVFSIGPSGANLTLLHSFSSDRDGAYPNRGLTLAGTTLYGTAEAGGLWGAGTVFMMDASGTGFAVLRNFNGTNSGSPNGGLILSSNRLYGTTWAGGARDLGTVFALATNGTAMTNLHSFTTNSTDGSLPYGELVLAGNTLFGTTSAGGAEGSGTVFSVRTNGTGFAVLHSFSYDTDGAAPYAGLVLSGDTLYGTTFVGGDWGSGTVFALNTNGTGFSVLHSLLGDTEGGAPYASLLLWSNTLFGTTSEGGPNGNGTVFSVGTNGLDFTVLHAFTATDPVAGTNLDGASPYDGLTLSGTTLYGTTTAGGRKGVGTIFGLQFSPVITGPPQNLTVTNGDPATFAATASGPPPLTYQWQKDGTNLADGGSLSGSTSSTLTLSSTATNDAGGYTIVIANGYGSVTSSVATLTVGVPPTIANAPVALMVTNGWAAVFSVAASGSSPLAYQWQKNGTNLASGGNVSGSTASTLTLNPTTTNDSGSYAVIITNVYGRVMSGAAALTVVAPPSITGQPQSVTVAGGNPAGFSVTALGTAPLAWQWQRNGTNLTDGSNLSGSTSTALTLNAASANDAGIYTVVVSNAYGRATSLPAILTVGVAPRGAASGLTRAPDGSVTIRFAGGPGFAYLVQAATNLKSPVAWEILGAGLAPASGLWQFTDTNANRYPARFYRSAAP